MKTVSMLLHFVGAGGNDHFVRTQTQRILRLARGGRQHHHVGAKGMGEFHAHVAEPAQAHNADLLALADLVVAEGGIGGDTGTQQGSAGGQIEISRHPQHEGFVHDHMIGIAAVGHATEVFVRGVVGEDGATLAELFKSVAAVFATAAGIHHAADCGEITFLKMFDLGTGFDDAPDNLVAEHAGIGRATPLIAADVQIRVANTAKKNLDMYIFRAGLAARDAGRC